ncbi:MAG TPA: hypothetical protein VGZ47_12700, partial [Gemmataceae bacterium]|nr:hypothetical protein [Gemmataceae bacterium]
MRDNDRYEILDDDDYDRPRRGYWDEDDDFDRRPRRPKNQPSSGLGILSLVIGLVLGAIEFVNIAVAGVLAQNQGGDL